MRIPLIDDPAQEGLSTVSVASTDGASMLIVNLTSAPAPPGHD